MRTGLAAFLILVLAACGGGDDPIAGDGGHDAGSLATDGGVDGTGGADGSATDVPASGPDGSAPALPDTPDGRKLAWLLELLNGPPAAITADVVKPHFAPSFLAQLSAADLATVLVTQAKDYAPVRFVGLESEGPQGLVAKVHGRLDRYLRIRLSTAGGESFVSLLFQFAPDLDPKLATWQGLEGRLAGLAPRVGVLIATLGPGGCRVDHALAPEVAQPLGSLFKIYVLGGLLAKVQAGEAMWSDVITIREALKSLPSPGTLQTHPEGTELAADFVARKMIQISDNTATDHLIDFVGRERIEQHQAVMGHSQPAANIPFLSTRDLFVLKLVAGDAERAAYLAADVPARRTILATNAARPLPPLELVAQAWDRPRDIATLEWFASPADVCRAFDWLRTKGQEPDGQNALTALSLNPGLDVDQGTFRYIGYKGGSEPGVLALGWLLQRRSDDVWRAVVLLSADPDKPVAESPILYNALATVQLAGR